MAAKLMGIDPMSIKFIRLAHEMGLGTGNPREIEIVGDEEAAQQNWNFVGRVQENDLCLSHAAPDLLGTAQETHRMVSQNGAGALVLSGSAWPLPRQLLVSDLSAQENAGLRLNSDWGRLFRNWETVTPDEQGFPDVGDEDAVLQKAGFDVFKESFRILWMAIVEAPEITAHQRRREDQYYMQQHGQGRSKGIALALFLLALPILLLLIMCLRGKDNES